MRTFEGKGFYPLDLDQLPKGWTSAWVRDLCIAIQSGFASGDHNSDGQGVPHLRPMNVDREGRLDLQVVKYVSASVDVRRLARGDVLFNNTNSPALVGKTTAISTDADLAFSNHMTRLRPGEGVAYEYLAHHLHFLWMGGYFLHRCTNHVNQASIAAEELATTVPLAVPPPEEQQRIVEAIDAYLSRLDAAVASLERVQTKLKAYRASILKAAVEGRLVPTEASIARAEKRNYEPANLLLERILKERRKRWEQNELAKFKAAGKTPKDDKWKAKYEEPAGPDTKNLPELPEGWCWARAEQVSEFITKGTTPTKSEMQPGKGEVPYIKVYNLRFDGSLDFTQDPTFITTEVHRRFLGRSICMPNDVLMNIVGPPLGKVSVVPSTFPEWNINQAIARYRPVAGMSSHYLAHVLLGDQALRWAESRAKATAGQFNLTLEIARDIPIPLPPEREQPRIVEELDRQFSASAAIASDALNNAARCARLRQAILKWAFQGKLTDQNPNDQPAQLLLQRILLQRSIPKSTPKSKPKSK